MRQRAVLYVPRVPLLLHSAQRALCQYAVQRVLYDKKQQQPLVVPAQVARRFCRTQQRAQCSVSTTLRHIDQEHTRADASFVRTKRAHCRFLVSNAAKKRAQSGQFIAAIISLISYPLGLLPMCHCYCIRPVPSPFMRGIAQSDQRSLCGR